MFAQGYSITDLRDDRGRLTSFISYLNESSRRNIQYAIHTGDQNRADIDGSIDEKRGEELCMRQ